MADESSFPTARSLTIMVYTERNYTVLNFSSFLPSSMNAFLRWSVAALFLSSLNVGIAMPQNLEPETRTTCLGTRYTVRPAWDQAIREKVKALRKQIDTAHSQNRKVLYISLPLGTLHGGLRPFNEMLGRMMKEHLKRLYPNTELILPGQTETELRNVHGHSPNGGEYLYMWTQVLMGKDCTGDIDWIYYMDTRDIITLLKLSPVYPRYALEQYLERLAKLDPETYGDTAHTPEKKQHFLNYYLYLYSPSSSKGVRDEWNMVQQVSGCSHNKNPIFQHINGTWTQHPQQPLERGYQLP